MDRGTDCRYTSALKQAQEPDFEQRHYLGAGSPRRGGEGVLAAGAPVAPEEGGDEQDVRDVECEAGEEGVAMRKA